MYSNKLAVAIKHNGKILRENKDLVMLPYGSEFSVLVKNLNSKRVKFTLSIDGANALDDTEIIVNANSETEIKRFIRNGNMDEGNAFKFIERTTAIEDGPRGIRVDDGVVRVEFWFEQDKPEIKINNIYWEKHHYRDYYQQPYHDPFFKCGGISGVSGASGSIARGQVINQGGGPYNATFSATSASAQSLSNIMPVNDIGITVPGSKVEQKFTTVYGFLSETNSHTIILRLVGVIGEVEVTKPITVNTKQKCTTCGKVNKATSAFCSACGTALTLL